MKDWGSAVVGGDARKEKKKLTRGELPEPKESRFTFTWVGRGDGQNGMRLETHSGDEGRDEPLVIGANDAKRVAGLEGDPRPRDIQLHEESFLHGIRRGKLGGSHQPGGKG